MQEKIVNRWFLGLLAFMVFAPLIQMTTHAVRVKPLEERRQLAEVKNILPRLQLLDTSLSTDINSWFNDHYGFRDALIRMKHEADYQLLGLSDKVLIGDDGWLFGIANLDGLLRANNRKTFYYPRILKSVQELEQCLAGRGIQLVIVYNPGKSTLYGEHMPAFVTPPASNGLAYDVAEALEKDTHLIFINGQKILGNHKDEIVFYKTDMHMNLRGSMIVYRELLRRLSQASGISFPALRHLTFYNQQWHNGDEERFIAKSRIIGETLAASNDLAKVMEDYPQGHWTKDIGHSPMPGYPDLPVFDFKFENLRKDVLLLPTTVIFGTSYTDLFFEAGYQDAFNSVYRTKSNFASDLPFSARLEPVVNNLPPGTRFFVLEYPEQFLFPILTDLPLAKACPATGANLTSPPARQ